MRSMMEYGTAPQGQGRNPSFKRGGTMKKSGRAKVHKGERIMGKKKRGRMSGR